MFHLGGAYCDVAEDASAFGGRRRPTWAVSATCVALDQESFEADREWSRRTWKELRAYPRDGSTYLNFTSDLEMPRLGHESPTVRRSIANPTVRLSSR